MSHQSRWEYVKAIYARYRRASRRVKQAILNEFCANTRYNRKDAIRLLSGPPPDPVRARTRRPRTPAYAPRVVSVLAAVWGCPWAVRLKALVPLWMPWIRKQFRLDPEVERQLLRISPRQIDPAGCEPASNGSGGVSMAAPDRARC